ACREAGDGLGRAGPKAPEKDHVLSACTAAQSGRASGEGWLAPRANTFRSKPRPMNAALKGSGGAVDRLLGMVAAPQLIPIGRPSCRPHGTLIAGCALTLKGR